MMPTTACVLAFTLVTSSLGEQSLRGQPRPQGFLALEKATAWNSLSNLISQRPSDDKHMKEVPADHKDFAIMNASEILVSFVVWFIMYAIIAAFYFTYVRWHVEELTRDKKRHTIAKHDDDGEGNLRHFSSSLFHCNKQLKITFWSFCCPGIRWSDTMDKLGIHRFWKGFWIMTALYCLSFLPIASVFCQLTVVMYMTYHRQELRQAFDFEEQGGATWVTDCFSYMCCMCCAVAQEARHTRLACIVEHKAIHIWPESARLDSPRSDAVQ